MSTSVRRLARLGQNSTDDPGFPSALADSILSSNAAFIFLLDRNLSYDSISRLRNPGLLAAFLGLEQPQLIIYGSKRRLSPWRSVLHEFLARRYESGSCQMYEV